MDFLGFIHKGQPFILLQLLKAFRIKFQKFAAHAHKVALINETFIPTWSLSSSLSTESSFIVSCMWS